MDERNTHGEDELLDTEADDLEDTGLDDEDTTPTKGEREKESAEEVKQKQKDAWKKKIASGEKSIDDMPQNLAWLKKEIEQESKDKGRDEKPDGLESKIQKALREERAAEDFNDLVDDLESLDISSEQDAQLKEEYEDLISDFQNPTPSQKLKCMQRACRLVGIKDISEVTRERRRKGRSMIPTSGSRRRTTVEKDKTTEIEKRLGGNLPPGFRA